MKALLTILFLASIASAQSQTFTLSGGDRIRIQRTDIPGDVPAFYDFSILNSHSLSISSDGQPHIYFSVGREVVVNRMPGVERAVTIAGANMSNFNYNEPLFIMSGTDNPNHPGINWNSAITIASPTNSQRITGFAHGLWIEDQHVAGTGRAIWYRGNGNHWSVEADGSQWIWTASPYVNGNASRFGMWCESLAECYLDSQAFGTGTQPAITIKGPVLNIEAPLNVTSTVTVQEQRGFTGSCPAGQVPVFKEGIAVGCQ